MNPVHFVLKNVLPLVVVWFIHGRPCLRGVMPTSKWLAKWMYVGHSRKLLNGTIDILKFTRSSWVCLRINLVEYFFGRLSFNLSSEEVNMEGFALVAWHSHPSGLLVWRMGLAWEIIWRHIFKFANSVVELENVYEW